MPWFTYILQCSDKTFYIGITNNLSKRVTCHNLKKGAKSIRGKLPARLVYSESFLDKVKAQKREIQLKTWTHNKKKLLVSGKIS